MPSVPKWIGDTIENVLSSKYLEVRVSSLRYLRPGIKEISLEGNFEKTNFYPGYAVAFRVSDTEFRNYTIASFDPFQGHCKIIFYLNGNGPGSHFAQNLEEGNMLKMVVPRGHKMFSIDKCHHFFFGDETSLGLFHLFASEIQKNRQQYSGILELDKDNLQITDTLGLKMQTVLKTPRNSTLNALCWLQKNNELLNEIGRTGIFYLTGNGVSVQKIRVELKKLGVPTANIKLQTYWMEGKTGI